MFDVATELALNLPPSNGGSKQIIVRYPTDDEWIDWRHQHLVVVRSKKFGQRRFQTEAAKTKPCDVALVKAIRLDSGAPSVTAREAFSIISQLAHCEVIGQPIRDKGAYAIQLKVMRKLLTTHTLRSPTIQETLEFERHWIDVAVNGSGRRREVRINFKPGMNVYGKLMLAVEGYAGAVGDQPVDHARNSGTVSQVVNFGSARASASASPRRTIKEIIYDFN